MKKIKELTKEEVFRIKGLNNFIKNCDQVAAEEFSKMNMAAGSMINPQLLKDYEYAFRAGFLSCLKRVCVQIGGEE